MSPPSRWFGVAGAGDGNPAEILTPSSGKARCGASGKGIKTPWMYAGLASSINSGFVWFWIRLVFRDEYRVALRANETGAAIHRSFLKLVSAQGCVTNGTDDTNHDGLLEYCNSIQSFSKRNTVCLSDCSL
jgi:hypothetical protein